MAIRLDGKGAALKDMIAGVDEMIEGTPRVEGPTGPNAGPSG